MCFSCFCHFKYRKSITLPLQCDFFDGVYFSLCTSMFSIFQQLTSKKSAIVLTDLRINFTNAGHLHFENSFVQIGEF